MNKTKLLKLFLAIQKSAQQGISLTELLVATIMSGIILAIAAKGFINVLTANQGVESKTVRSATLSRALAYIQNDIKGARTVTRTSSSCTGSNSANCLVLTYPNSSEIDGTTCTISNPYILYGYEDISSGSQTWLKPGVLKRKVFCDSTTGGNWQVIADGLISGNETSQPTTTCNQDLSQWTGNTTLYGRDSNSKGGFRFCLETDDTDPANATPNNRLVRIFLHGYIVDGTNTGNTISVNTVGFARAN